jgi:hypothetical protein
MWPKLRLQPDSGAAGFSHRASATGNLTMPIGARSAFLERFLAVALEHQAGCAPDVDLRNHGKS